MSWTLTATTLIAVSIIVAITASSILKMMFSNEANQRDMDAIQEETFDCRALPGNAWQTIVERDISKHGIPADSFVFIDYIDNQEVECEQPHALDYGIAVGFGLGKTGVIQKQISYVLRTEYISESSVGDELDIIKRQKMVTALSKGLKNIRNVYQASDGAQLQDDEFKISKATIENRAIRYVFPE